MKKSWIQCFHHFVLANKLSRLLFLATLATSSPFQAYFTTTLPLDKRIQSTNRYSKLFTLNLSCPNTKQKHIIDNSLRWEVNQTNFPFSELILSWNAPRPKKGFYSFWTKVKHQSSTSWQKIAEWGVGIQKSFLDTTDPIVQTKHVRVELAKRYYGSAFSIKILAHDKAPLKALSKLTVCLAHEPSFTPTSASFNQPSLLIKNVRRQSQMFVPHPRFSDLCSPTSTTLVTDFLCPTAFPLPSQPNPAETNMFPDLLAHDPPFAEQVATFACNAHDQSYLDIFGNWPLNMAQAYAVAHDRLQSHVERLNTFNDLYQYLLKQIPIAVSIRGTLTDAFKPYPHGHFVVVIGWDNQKKRVLCIDPAFSQAQESIREYRADEFFAAWGRSRHLSYIIKKRDS